jgi:hypothetical protein
MTSAPGGRQTSRAGARPDLDAYERATRIELKDAASELIGILGPRLAAYICGATETRSVHQWAEGKRIPRDPVPARIRLALRVAALITTYDGHHVAQAWFQGLNPQLDDRSPAKLLREGKVEEVGPEIIAAARAFVVGG